MTPFTIFTIVAGFILVAFILLLRFFSHVYENRQKPHDRTPDEFGIPFEEVLFPTLNDCSLYGWWIPSESMPPKEAITIVLVHGWNRNLGRMLRYIQHLHPMGFNLLAFDARHHGSSDPDDHSSMLKFSQDIQAAVDFVSTLDVDPERIGVIGLSIGGAGSIHASSQNSRIRAVVSVGAPAHPADIMIYEFRKRRIPYFPVVWLLFKYIEFKIGKRLDDFAPVNNIAFSSAQFLIIHGKEDDVVPPEHGRKLLVAANPDQARLWLLDGRGHSDCHREPGFWEQVSDFMEQALPRQQTDNDFLS